MRRIVWAALFGGAIVLLATPAQAVDVLPPLPMPAPAPVENAPAPTVPLPLPAPDAVAPEVPVGEVPVEAPALPDTPDVPDVPDAAVDVEVPIELDAVEAVVPEVDLHGVLGATTPAEIVPATPSLPTDIGAGAGGDGSRPAAVSTDTPAATLTRPVTAHSSPRTSEFGAVLRAARDSAGEFVLPFALVVMVLAFLLVQPWFDQGDGRLAAVTVEDERLGFS